MAEVSLTEPLIDLIAERFRVLGEPMRIRLLNELRTHGDASVGELQEAVGASQQNVSKHLSILHSAGLVERTKQGTQTRYAIGDPSVFEICDAVWGGIRRKLDELDSILRSGEAA